MSRIGDFIPRSSGSPPHSPPTHFVPAPGFIPFAYHSVQYPVYPFRSGSYSPPQTQLGAPMSMSGPITMSPSPLMGSSSLLGALTDPGPAPLQSTLSGGAPTDERSSTEVREAARNNGWRLQIGAPQMKWESLDMSSVGLVRLPDNFDTIFNGIRELYLSRNILRDIPPAILKMNGLRVLDLSRNEISVIPPGIAYLRELTTLNLSGNRLVSLPAELGACFRLSQLELGENPSLVPWFEKELPNIDASDVGKVVLGLLNMREFLPHRDDPGAVPERKWFYPDSSSEVEKEGEGDVRMRLVSYNVLAECYCNQQTYRYCPARWLSREQRTRSVLREIKALSGDIIALQEVDALCYETLEKELKALGYEGAFEQKTGGFIGVGDDKRLLDGSATFWRANKFRLIERGAVSYKALAFSRFENVTEDTAGISRLRSKEHIALMTLLEVLSGAGTGQRILVSNTHIFWNPSSPDIKLMQCQFQIEEAIAFRKKFLTGGADPDSIPLVFMGDYNSTPTSAVYQLFSTAHVPPDHNDWNHFSFPPYTEKGIDNNTNLFSAYSVTKEPAYTNCANDYIGTLDYIWLSKKSFRVANTFSVPDINLIHPLLRPFPSPAFPSDHLLIAADVYFKLK